MSSKRMLEMPRQLHIRGWSPDGAYWSELEPADHAGVVGGPQPLEQRALEWPRADQLRTRSHRPLARQEEIDPLVQRRRIVAKVLGLAAGEARTDPRIDQPAVDES